MNRSILCRIGIHSWKFVSPDMTGSGAFEQCGRCSIQRYFSFIYLTPPERFEDEFNGGDENLLSSAKALLDMDADGILIPHGIGGHARTIISALAARMEKRL